MYYMGLSVNQISIALKGFCGLIFFFFFYPVTPGKFNMQLYFHLTLCVIYFIYMTGLCEMRMTPISEGALDSSCCLSPRGDNTCVCSKRKSFFPHKQVQLQFHPWSRSVIVVFGLYRHQHHKHQVWRATLLSHKPEKAWTLKTSQPNILK